MLAAKIEPYFQTEEFRRLREVLTLFVVRLITFLQSWPHESVELKKGFEYAQEVIRRVKRHVAEIYETSAMAAAEDRLQSLKDLLTKMTENYTAEIDKFEKMQADCLDQQKKFKSAQSEVDKLKTRLQDSRNLTSKAEKRAKNEESRCFQLLAEKTRLDKELQTTSQELTALKKKSMEERGQAQRQKDRDQERIRQLEYEKFERDGERDRLKKSFEERLSEARSREHKAEKERKQAVMSSTGARERARTAEVGQIRLTYELHEKRFERARETIQLGLAEAEKALTRPYSSPSDLNIYRKSLADFKVASDALDQVVTQAKVHYDDAARSIWKGQHHLAHVELFVPVLPALPQILRLPPVQLPSSAPAPPVISSHPPGAIGQHRSGSAPNSPHPGLLLPSDQYGYYEEDRVPSMTNDALWSWTGPGGDAASSVYSEPFQSANTELTSDNWPDYEHGDFVRPDTNSLYGNGLFSSSWSTSTGAKNKHLSTSSIPANWPPPPPYQH